MEMMMKILLVAVNAKYIHSNLAVYSLHAFAEQYRDNIKITEMTINHSEEYILKEIYREKADVIAFSCYIWNIDLITRVTQELKKVQKDAIIWYGGPEVSYDAAQCLSSNQNLDGIMIGEGEQTFLELAGYYSGRNITLEAIHGIAYKESARSENKSSASDNRAEGVPENDITITPAREILELDAIPFPYEDMEYFKNRIIYYESSRGCPFSCSYCLSSIEKKVRLRSSELVMRELKLFLDYKVPQVKFVDRTFNCNKKHTMAIWRFIRDNDNGVTNFHFEISADLLTSEEIDFLSQLRPGLVQLEIGVQSTNPDTVDAIHRRMDFEKLKENVGRIKEAKNIHQHLDLIAGLPLEGYLSFENSFRDVYLLKPDQLQLGFLKVLKGSLMESECSRYGIEYRSSPPYEVLFTDQMSYEEILKLKDICEMVEVYYNSTQFTYSIRFLEHFYTSPMKMYQSLSDFYENTEIMAIAHSRIKRYEVLLGFFENAIAKGEIIGDRKELIPLFEELLVLDVYLREAMKTRPGFAHDNPLQGNLRELYTRYQRDRKTIHIEQFSYDVFAAARTGKAVKRDMTVLFDYSNRDPLDKSAILTILE